MSCSKNSAWSSQARRSYCWHAAALNEWFADKLLLDVLPGIKQESDLYARLVTVLETGQPHDIEVFYDADGLRGWFRSMVVKLDDGLAVSFGDITDRKQYEQQLSYQAFILKNVSDAIVAVDRDLNITLWNHGAASSVLSSLTVM